MEKLMERVSFEKMHKELQRVLLKLGFSLERAEKCAILFAEASRDGIYSHGLNRFPRFVNYINQGYVDVNAEPKLAESLGVLEKWDGQLGPGNLNAQFCMDRSISIARKNSLGCIAIKNTNHWMRAGAYGWQAAEANCIGICWTNTEPNMPAWGAKESLLGNNPLVMAVPRKEGHIVLDMAMSMFSYGKMNSYKLAGKELPFDGGFDYDGNLTKDPGMVKDTFLALPIGYWKGAGLSLMLDLIASLLSGGRTSRDIGGLPDEYGVSQVFMAIDMDRKDQTLFAEKITNEIVEYLHNAETFKKEDKVYYPGERVLATRHENLQKGIPVEAMYWQQILDM
jgi:3-dehydro-L-gulonate 2-dehydrogenase